MKMERREWQEHLIEYSRLIVEQVKLYTASVGSVQDIGAQRRHRPKGELRDGAGGGGAGGRAGLGGERGGAGVPPPHRLGRSSTRVCNLVGERFSWIGFIRA